MLAKLAYKRIESNKTKRKPSENLYLNIIFSMSIYNNFPISDKYSLKVY